MSACLDCGGHGGHFPHCVLVERSPDEWCSDCGQKHSKCECGQVCRCATLRPDPTQYKPAAAAADQPGAGGEADGQVEESKPPWAYGRVFPCTVTDELALPGGDSEPTPPAPSAGQDTGQLREEQCRSCRGDLADDCGHHSWLGLMALLDEHWPEDIFPTRSPDDASRDAGARIVSLIRWANRIQRERDEARAQVQRVRELDPVEVALGGLAYVIDEMDRP